MTPQLPSHDPAGGGGTHIHTGTEMPTAELGNVGDIYIRKGSGGDPASIYVSASRDGSAVAPLVGERQYLTVTTGLTGSFHLREYFDGFPYDSAEIDYATLSAETISDAIQAASPAWWVSPAVSEETPYPNGTRRFRLDWGAPAGNRPLLELYTTNTVYGLTDQQAEAIYEKVDAEGGQWEALIEVPTEQYIASEVDAASVAVYSGAPDNSAGADGDVALGTYTPMIPSSISMSRIDGQHFTFAVNGISTSGNLTFAFTDAEAVTIYSTPFSIAPDAGEDTLLARMQDAFLGEEWLGVTVAEGDVYVDGQRELTLTFVQSFTIGTYDGVTAGYPVPAHDPAFYTKEGEGWQVQLYGTSEPLDASLVPYDNTTSGLTASELQAAVDELAAAPAPGGGGSNLEAYWKTTVSTSANSASTWRNIGSGLAFEGDGESAYEVTFRVPTVEVAGAAQGHIRVWDEESGVTVALGHFATAGKRPGVVGGLMLPFSGPATMRAQIKFDGSVTGTLKADSTLGGETYAAELTVVKLGVPPEV